MDRVTAGLTRWAAWFRTSVFHRKRERSPELPEVPESNGALLNLHRQKRRRSVSPITPNPVTADIELDTSQLGTQNEGVQEEPSKSRTPVSSNVNSVKKLSQQTQFQFPRNPNPNRFGRVKRIINKPQNSASGPSQPEASSKRDQPRLPRIAPDLTSYTRMRKARRIGGLDRMELSKIIHESQSCFVKAKKQLMKLEETEQSKETTTIQKPVFSQFKKLLNVQRPVFRILNPLSIPSPSDLPPPVLFKTQENWTPFADQKLRVFAEKLRPLLEEPEQEEPVSNYLTEDDHVAYANLNTAAEEQVFFEFDNCQYTGHDLRTLLPEQWLNDNIINGYMKLLQLRDQEQKSDLSCHFCRSFLINSIFPKYNYSNIRKWTLEKKLRNWGQTKKSIIDCDLVFFPVHLGIHWVLVLADLRTKTIKFYDSLASKLQPSLQVPHSFSLFCYVFA